MVVASANLVLAGRLEVFPLADVLQLIGSGERNGTLVLEDDRTGNCAEIEFAAGRVVRIDVENRPEPLGAILLRRGVVDADTLTEALLDQCSVATWRPLGTVLAEHGLVELEALGGALREQLEQDLGVLLLWERGAFRFVLDVGDPNVPLLVSVDVRQLLLDALRRSDESARAAV